VLGLAFNGWLRLHASHNNAGGQHGFASEAKRQGQSGERRDDERPGHQRPRNGIADRLKRLATLAGIAAGGKEPVCGAEYLVDAYEVLAEEVAWARRAVRLRGRR
jgi:hypothetical protein